MATQYDNTRVNTILTDQGDSTNRLIAALIDVQQAEAGAGVATAANQASEIAALGAITDTAVTNPASSGSIVALLKGWLTKAAVYFPAALGQGTMAQSMRVVLPSDQSQVPVTLGVAIALSVAGNPALLVAEDGVSFSHIATSTTTVVKSAPGTLHSIIVNTKGTVASTITVYNNTAGSGAVIAIIDSLNLSGTFIYDVVFSVGLTLVTTGTIAPDITVSYR